jgi:hypothetical protein
MLLQTTTKMLVVILLALTSSTHPTKIGDKNTSKIKDINTLYGQHLRVSAFHVSIFYLFICYWEKWVNHLITPQYPPFFMVTHGKDGNNTYSGYCFNIIDWMIQQYKLKWVLYNIMQFWRNYDDFTNQLFSLKNAHYAQRITFVPVNQSEIVNYGITQAIINQLVKRNV